MKTSDEMTEWIRKFEGLRLSAYKCAAGVWTIGYGHTGNDVKRGMVINRFQAEDYLKKDIARHEAAVGRIFPDVELMQGQFDALVSFCFNLGEGNLQSSTLAKKIKANAADPSIPREFSRWVYAKGVKLPGLVKRRQVEAKFWEGQP